MNLPQPAAGGIGLPLPPLVREPGREDKDGEGLEKGEKIDFCLRVWSCAAEEGDVANIFLPRKKKKKENKSPV